MGKRIISQRRGKGSATYRAPGFRYPGKAGNVNTAPGKQLRGTITDIIHSQGHSAPLLVVTYADNKTQLSIAPHGMKVGDIVETGSAVDAKPGNTLALAEMDEGTLVFNLENKPGDGGKFVRASGAFARVLSRTRAGVLVELPSKKKKLFNKACKATIGVIAGGGRKEKPFLKAGKKYHRQRARNKLYPKTSSVAMNAVDHPYGGSSSAHKGVVTIAPRHAPPGRKVGKLRARRTGRRKGK